MHENEVIHEQVRFGNDEYLAGILSYPADGTPTMAVLVCSPHPNFGGDMENNIVAALAERISVDSISLKFNYRGVGQSKIKLPSGISSFDYWENIEETLEYAEPLADTSSALNELSRLSAGLPLITVGYSFGAIMGTRTAVQDTRVVAMAGISPPLKRVGFEHLADCPKPCLLVCGEDDFVFDTAAATKLVLAAGRNLILERPAADHFFVGLEHKLADRIALFAQQSSSRARTVGVDGSK